MKKLMIAAAAAAMTGAVFADAQVYDVSLSVKSTATATGKTTTKKNPFVTDDGTIAYRKQASYSWKGLIWGCDCGTITGEWGLTGDGTTDAVAGNILWDNKSGAWIWDGNAEGKFGWKFINAMGLNGEKSEGTWEIGDELDDEVFYFLGSGFGTTKYLADCGSYVNLSGSFAGWMIPLPKEIGECLFCGDTTGDVYPEAWDFCECETLADATKTAAYGTWNVKYNSSLSKKLSKNTSILDVYNFKKLPKVAARIAELEAEIRQGGEPTECDELADAIEAKKGELQAIDLKLNGIAYGTALEGQAIADAAFETVKNTEMDFTSYKLDPAQGKIKVSAFVSAYNNNVGKEEWAWISGTDKYSQICKLTNDLDVAYNDDVVPVKEYINFVQTNVIDAVDGSTVARQKEIKVWKQFITDLQTFDVPGSDLTKKTLAAAEKKVTDAGYMVPVEPDGMEKALLVLVQKGYDELADNTAKAIAEIQKKIAAWDAAREATGYDKAKEEKDNADDLVGKTDPNDPKNVALWLAQKSALQSELNNLELQYTKAGCED